MNNHVNVRIVDGINTTDIVADKEIFEDEHGNIFCDGSKIKTRLDGIDRSKMNINGSCVSVAPLHVVKRI